MEKEDKSDEFAAGAGDCSGMELFLRIKTIKLYLYTKEIIVWAKH